MSFFVTCPGYLKLPNQNVRANVNNVDQSNPMDICSPEPVIHFMSIF